MSKKITVQIVNAFTDAGEGGNPAGVVYPADELSNETKQAIATKVGLSEISFVSKSHTDRSPTADTPRLPPSHTSLNRELCKVRKVPRKLLTAIAIFS